MLVAASKRPVRPAKSCSWWGRIAGDDRTFTLEHRLANGVMLVVGVACAFAAAANIVAALPRLTVLIPAAVSVLHLLLFRWSRRTASYEAPAWISLVTLNAVLYPCMWFGNFGLDGSTHLVGVGIGVAGVSIFAGWKRGLVVAMTIATTVALFATELAMPALVGAYETRALRYVDGLVTTLLIGSAIAANLVATQASHRREREKAREYAAIVERTNHELEAALAENQQLAQTDALTGLPNRRHFEPLLAQKVAEAARYGRAVSIVVFDVDHFKAFNDHHGHATGDAILRSLGGLVAGSLRGADVCARWGGEEFVVLCPETDGAGAATVAERVRAGIESHRFCRDLRVTVSLGVASHAPGDDAGRLFTRADEALYEAKRGGRNRVAIATETSSSLSPLAGKGPGRGASPEFSEI